ncbi:MAG: DUF1640 domain-containing protein [Desulfovibrio sp.]|nr:DUF1640 domain-containing protein [Desulfovibrio sp.]
MSTLTFDTLAFSNKLQESGIPRKQADAMASANSDAFQNMLAARELVTKQDLALALAETRLELEKTINTNKHEILKWLIGTIIAQTTLLLSALGIGLALLKS